MRCNTVLFDHDDTLLPTFDIRARVLVDAGHEVLGREIDGAAVLAASHGRNLEQMSDQLTGGDLRLARKLAAAYRERYYLANQDLTPYDGIPELLQGLKERDMRIAVVTSKLGSGAREELQRTGLAPFFEHLVGAEDVSEPKPAPEPLLKMLGFLGESPDTAIMVGDTAADVLGARAAGVRSVAALWGTRDRKALLDLAPDHVVETPQDILTLL